ncbi:MAG: SIS domain-containing protein [Thermoflexus sp.]|uniref:SIS domain-containing protein n=1 Tax=Thermoflexus sp. TaxID=1969742 RepID=UPI0025D3852D|nr:SIS domain-containing protein [Thermoflexus sp.]MCS6964859.1 SIS domain-containing protein [Thermoflexus sp.]
MWVEQEIRQQPEVAVRLIREGWEEARRIAEAVRRFQPALAVLAARGSSDNAARYGQYLLGAFTGLPAALATPSLFTFYRRPPRLDRAWVIGISQSGRSPDIVEVIQEARRQGGWTLAITNDPASPLAAAAHAVLPLCAGEERAVAATKTYTAQLIALALLAAAWTEDAAMREDLLRLPEAIARALDTEEAAREAAAFWRTAVHGVVIGRGFHYATAFEVALKLKELTYIVAEPYSSADFLHGPIVLVEPGFPVFLIASGPTFHSEMESLAGMLRERKAHLTLCSEDPALLARADVGIPLPPVPEWLSPAVAVIPGQWFAVSLARWKGLDPDQPRGLRKITETR